MTEKYLEIVGPSQYILHVPEQRFCSFSHASNPVKSRDSKSTYRHGELVAVEWKVFIVIW